MKTLLMAAGALALAFTAPAAAKPDHAKGHGWSQGKHDKKGDRDRYDRDRYERDRHNSYWGRSCPPGLAKKRNGCQPPGQAKKRWDRGDRWARNYGYQWQYNQIPYDWRSRYNLRNDYRYYYNDGYLYQVDPRTMLVQQVIRGVFGY